MFSGQVLSAPEQAIYDEMSDEHADKLEWLQKNIKEMVDSKRLTLSEKEELLNTLSSSLEAAAEAKQGKKVANLTARRAHVETIEGVTHPLKHADEIFKLRLKCFPLAALEEKVSHHTRRPCIADVRHGTACHLYIFTSKLFVCVVRIPFGFWSDFRGTPLQHPSLTPLFNTPPTPGMSRNVLTS